MKEHSLNIDILLNSIYYNFNYSNLFIIFKSNVK